VRGSTNFVHPNWAGFDVREGLAHKLGKPVSHLNDANAAALWGHYAIFGANSRETSISDVVGPGNGGNIILDGNVVKGKNGFGGELGHVLIPYQSIAGIAGIQPHCNCGRTGDLESLCSLTAIEKTPCRIICGAIRATTWRSRNPVRRPKPFAAWRIRAIRCAKRFSGFRPTPWDFFLTKW
jgi:predicted NBD/HSP70 family sugar kinase